jgi:hypothetical protein
MAKFGIGQWAFIIGLIIVLLATFMADIVGIYGLPAIILVGLAVAALNITPKEAHGTLLAGVVLAIAGTGFIGAAMGGLMPELETLFANIGIFFLGIVTWFAIITIFFRSWKR